MFFVAKAAKMTPLNKWPDLSSHPQFICAMVKAVAVFFLGWE